MDPKYIYLVECTLNTVNGQYVDTGKKWPTPVVDGTGRAPWKTGQNHVRGTHTYTDP